MPVSNIALVTEMIMGKIRQALQDSSLPDDVFPDSMMREERQGMSFYLYHIKENSRYKNVPPAGNDVPPVKLNPMGLDLYYQLSAFSNIGDGRAALQEQALMTVALKALHDAPQLTLGDNRFRITLQPTPASDAVHNWTSGDVAMKLSAYYEVSPVMLEPEKPTLASGRVLLYGNYVFPSALPKITASKSIITFTMPDETVPRQVGTQPAQAAPGDTIVFEGMGFNDGLIQLRLFNFRYRENIVATNWNLVVAEDKLTATVQHTAKLERDSAIEVEILPGIYSAQVVITKTLRLSDGQINEFIQTSNQFPFMVTPVAAGELSFPIVTITGSGFQTQSEYGTQHIELVEVYIGEHTFQRTIEAAGEEVKQFRIDSRNHIEVKLPSDFVAGTYPLRVLVAGAESSPSWITIP